jgi:hypothetical protein
MILSHPKGERMNALRTLALFLATTSITALAQKPAIVKDTEAVGRLPYIHTLEYSCPLNNPSSCVLHGYTFPAVPAGYRLVVTYVSVSFPTNSPQSLSVLLTNGKTALDMDYAALDLQAPVCAAESRLQYNCVSSAPASFYLEGALAPNVIVGTGSTAAFTTDNTARVTVVGYLLSL